jgi:hypothetical protein
MRKINYDVLKTMLEVEGKSQHDCALHFKVSDAAISKAVRRMKSMELPESMDKLTPQQQRFALLKAAGASNLEAAQQSFDCATTDSAKSIGCKLMTEPDINTAIKDILAQEGYSLRTRIKKLGKLIDSLDGTVANKALDTSFKLDRSYPQERGGAPIHVDTGYIDLSGYRVKIGSEEFQTVTQIAKEVMERVVSGKRVIDVLPGPEPTEKKDET